MSGAGFAAVPELAWLWLGVACYAAASLVALRPTGSDVGRARLDSALLTLGVLALTGAIAVRWTRIDQGPFLTMFEVLLSNLFSLGLVYALIHAAVPTLRASATVVAPVLLLMGIWALSSSPEPVPLPATFDHPWLWLHVAFGKLFLAPCLIGAGVATLLLARRAVGTAPRQDGSADGPLDAWVWRLMSIAFVFQSLMLIAGAVWAHDAWGRYWAWDPLETWSFVTWLVLGALLHGRVTFRMPPELGWSLVIGVFVLAFLTFFGVPFVSLAPHKGVM